MAPVHKSFLRISAVPYCSGEVYMHHILEATTARTSAPGGFNLAGRVSGEAPGEYSTWQSRLFKKKSRLIKDGAY